MPSLCLWPSTSEPTFGSVAKLREPRAKDVEDVAGAEDEAPIGEAEAEGDDRKRQSCDNEQLSGLDGAHAEDPLARVLLLQKRLQVVADEGRRVQTRQKRYHLAANKNDGDLVAINGQATFC